MCLVPCCAVLFGQPTSTFLTQVDHQHYVSPAAFLADAHLIVTCAEELYGQPQEDMTAAAGGAGAGVVAAGGGNGVASRTPASASAAHVHAPHAAAAGSAAVSGQNGVSGAAEHGPMATAADAAGSDLMLCDQDGQHTADGDAGAAAAGGDATLAAAATAAAVRQHEGLSLPAVRVSVCKEVSRASELKVGVLCGRVVWCGLV